MNFQGSFYKSYHHGAHIFNGLLFQNSKKLGRYDVYFKRVDVDSITLCCHTNANFHIFKVCKLETFQDFSIKLDIEPLMHLLKISIFSLNSDIIRLTKIMNNLVKDCKIRTFKVIFQCLKLVESFRKKNSVKNI